MKQVAGTRRRIVCMVSNVQVIPIVNSYYCSHLLHTMYFRMAHLGPVSDFSRLEFP